MTSWSVTALHHVGLLVDDVDASLPFYTDVLGLRERDDRPQLRLRGAWLDVGAGELHLFEGRPRVIAASTSRSAWTTSTPSPPGSPGSAWRSSRIHGVPRCSR
jgi:catechol 2,3-dioxygenase-like lactoylglutathione lyase family enzyme